MHSYIQGLSAEDAYIHTGSEPSRDGHLVHGLVACYILSDAAGGKHDDKFVSARVSPVDLFKISETD